MDKADKNVDSDQVAIESANVLVKLRKKPVQKPRKGKLPLPGRNQKRIDMYFKQGKSGGVVDDGEKSTEAERTSTSTSEVPSSVKSSAKKVPVPSKRFGYVVGKGKRFTGKTAFGLASFSSKLKRKAKTNKPASMSKKVIEKESDEMEILCAVGDACWEETLKYLGMDPDEESSAPKIINLAWIKQHCDELLDGRIIPFLFVVISEWYKDGGYIKSGSTAKVGDYEDNITAVFQSTDKANYGSILTPGSAVVLTNVRLQKLDNDLMITVPSKSIAFVGTKSVVDSALIDKSVTRMEKGVSVVNLGGWELHLEREQDMEGKRVLSQNTKELFLFVDKVSGERNEAGERNAALEGEKTDAGSEAKDDGDETFNDGILKIVDSESKETTAGEEEPTAKKKEEVPGSSEETDWGDDSYDDVMANLDLQVMTNHALDVVPDGILEEDIQDPPESKDLVGNGEGAAEEKAAGIVKNEDEKSGVGPSTNKAEANAWEDDGLDEIFEKIEMPEAIPINEKKEQNKENDVWNDDEYDEIMGEIDEF